MFERELYPVVNIYFADAEYLRVELAVDRIGPLPADSRHSFHHAYNRTRRCGVAVGVEACLNGAADGLCVVPAAVEQVILKNDLYGLDVHRWLQAHLKPNRYLHSVKVAELCAILSDIYEVPVGQAV